MSVTDKKRNLPLALAALGIVFGDIGTSPLYAFQTAVNAASSVSSEATILGVASLVIWSLLLLVTFKYILVVMRADYHGEGGIFALLALLQKDKESPNFKLPLYVLVILFGAALLFGDGTITPAISVLSALEGLEVVSPAFKQWVIPITVAILIALFSVQRLGTGRLGRIFGWVMLLWFVAIGGIGLYWVGHDPIVLKAFNPVYGLALIHEAGFKALALMGCVVLAVTGVEALYADMGHFSRRSISLAWHAVALPALVLNYLGQASCALSNSALFDSATQRIHNPFFHMVPNGWPTLLLVILATLATVIASQALISGVFSLTAQAQELNFFPKLLVMHTSREERGQVYVPTTNWVLGAACILLVLTFRSSDNLANAYGLAVVGTMVITTISLALVTSRCWQWPLWRSTLLTALLLAIEIPFLVSCLTKFPEGGYFPVLVAAGLFAIMLTWHKGRAIILEHMMAKPCTTADLVAELDQQSPVGGQLIFITSKRNPKFAVARAFEMRRHGGNLRNQVIIMSLVNTMKANVDITKSVKVEELSPRLWHVVAEYGYMQEPYAVNILTQAREISGGKILANSPETFFVLGRELIVEYTGHRMVRWRRGLFGFLSRNVSYAPDYFYIPHSQITEFTWMLRA